jgi:hypothetical protein
MLKVITSVLAVAVLFTGLGMSAADAKAKPHKKAKPAVIASCSASPLMRDESRFANCWPMKK